MLYVMVYTLQWGLYSAKDQVICSGEIQIWASQIEGGVHCTTRSESIPVHHPLWVILFCYYLRK